MYRYKVFFSKTVRKTSIPVLTLIPVHTAINSKIFGYTVGKRTITFRFLFRALVSAAWCLRATWIYIFSKYYVGLGWGMAAGEKMKTEGVGKNEKEGKRGKGNRLNPA